MSPWLILVPYKDGEIATVWILGRISQTYTYPKHNTWHTRLILVPSITRGTRDLYLCQALHVVQILSLSHVVNCPNSGASINSMSARNKALFISGVSPWVRESVSPVRILIRLYLGPIADISIMRLSASWCHFRQCPWDRLGFCVSRKGGTGGGGWVHPKACPRLGSSLEATWLALGGPFLSFWA